MRIHWVQIRTSIEGHSFSMLVPTGESNTILEPMASRSPLKNTGRWSRPAATADSRIHTRRARAVTVDVPSGAFVGAKTELRLELPSGSKADVSVESHVTLDGYSIFGRAETSTGGGTSRRRGGASRAAAATSNESAKRIRVPCWTRPCRGPADCILSASASRSRSAWPAPVSTIPLFQSPNVILPLPLDLPGSSSSG